MHLGYLEFAEVEDTIDTEDYEKLAKEMEHASPLEIMDKALEKFGNDIAIAFRYLYFDLSPLLFWHRLMLQ